VSDYTLTTEEVRNAFSLMEDDAATQENFQNFDRWLESILQKTQIADGVKAGTWDEELQGIYPNHYTAGTAEQAERDQQKRELWDNPAFHEGRLWGRMEERERIIKPLEDLVGVYDQNPVTANFGIKVCLSVIRGSTSEPK
jgi:hypothetical protein